MIVSHSNMKSFQKCKRAFYYSVKLNLRPKVYPEAIELGLFGHDCMEEFFKHYLENEDYDAAVAAVSNYINTRLVESKMDSKILERSKILRQVLAFASYFVAQPWKVVAVEQNDNYPIDNDASFGFTPDLVCEWTMGPKKGTRFVIDYKFTGRYWSDRQINLVQQMPKYIIYRQKMYDENIRYAAIIMLNTRAAATDSGSKLYLVKWVPISKTKLQTIERENEAYVREIEPFMRMSAEEFEPLALRTPDEYACNMCFYADDICPMELNGLDTRSTIKANYIQNDYGYN